MTYYDAFQIVCVGNCIRANIILKITVGRCNIEKNEKEKNSVISDPPLSRTRSNHFPLDIPFQSLTIGYLIPPKSRGTIFHFCFCLSTHLGFLCKQRLKCTQLLDEHSFNEELKEY